MRASAQESVEKTAWLALPAIRARFDGLLALYERGLKIVLRHQFTTLLVMLGTIAFTGYLYVVIPKGFFPEQDTGLLQGITEAATDISFPAMVERQQALMDVVLKDPAVDSVSDYIGPWRLDADAQPGARLHRFEAAQRTRR